MKCYQCGSNNLIREGTIETEEKILFARGVKRYNLEAFICNECGHVEWYIIVENLEDVQKYYSKYLTDKGNVKNDLPIEVIKLSIRTYNCLKRDGINTIGDIFKKTDEEIKQIRRLGTKSFNEVKEMLSKMF